MALEDLLRYESSAVAALNVNKERDLAILAVESQYKALLGKDYEEDPLVRKSLAEAAEGLEQDNIANIGILQAIKVYNGKYERAFASTKFSDLTKYLTSGYKISDEVKANFEKYKDLTLMELAEKGKDKEISKEEAQEIAKAIQALGILRERKLRAKTLDIYNEVVKRKLDMLYPKKQEKE